MSIYAPVKIPTLMGIQTTPPQPPVTLPEVNHIPGYVYRLTCIPTGQFYIGSRVGNIPDKKMPKDDFWIHYHTSSEYVSELVNLHGKTSFEYEIIYEDCDRDKVFWHEQEQIKLHYNDPLILNKQFNWYKDKHKGTTMQRSNTGKGRRWKVTSPCGMSLIVSNLERFCKYNNLDPETMRGLARGKGKQYKGFKCSLVPELPKPEWFVTTKIGDYIEPIPLIEKVNPVQLCVSAAEPIMINFKHKEKTESLRSQYTKRTAAKKTAQQPKPVIPYSPSVAKGLAKKRANGSLSSDAIKSQETQRKNGTHLNGNKAASNARRKTWEITDPCGNVTVTHGLSDFCKENALSVQCMKDIALGRQIQHRGGWTCKSIASDKPPVLWEITNPQGDVVIIEDIKQFCIDNLLNREGMRKVANGYSLTYKGWKCKKVE